jgi:hypothetical protein
MSKSLSMALGIRLKNKKRKMADGGMVKPKTLGETIGYPKRMAEGGMVDEPRPSSVAQAILRKRKMDADELAAQDEQEPLEPEMDELNEAAADEASEGEDTYEKQNRIAAIRAKMRKRG